MNDEFVDFYEILELPINAERSELRKRISELYIEAQKNLDHRNFNTRVRYQQLFEVTLPQARYILLDDGRRHDYDRLVQASRAPTGSAPVASETPASQTSAAPSLEMGQGTNGAFTLSPGDASGIDALPDVAPDPEAVAREREELWNKWKSGLQSAMEREVAKENIKEGKTASTPLADRIEAVQTGAPQPQFSASTSAGEPTDTQPPATSPAKKMERPRVKFDFDGEAGHASGADASIATAKESVQPAPDAVSPQQLEERRTNHRREVIREELENTGVKGMAIGAAAVLVPGVIAMTIFMSVYYPPNKVSTLPLKNSAVAWLLWMVILAVCGYFGARMLSKSLRRKQAMQLQTMSYEALLRYTKKES